MLFFHRVLDGADLDPDASLDLLNHRHMLLLGSVGGVLSNVFKQECEYLMYSFNVMVEGKNVCRLGDPLWHNKKNICM